MGAQYRPGGLVFVSMNPRAGPQVVLNASDLHHYMALQGLKGADQSVARRAFDELTQVLADIMPRWRIYLNCVAPVLGAAGLDFAEVAYVNLLKWRPTTDGGLARINAISWHLHTRDQIELLAPSRVIAIGSDEGPDFRKRCTEQVDFDFIPRIHKNVRRMRREALTQTAAMVWQVE
jgi:hypothetical protein